MSKKLCPTGVDLASRQSAARLRQDVESELGRGGNVVVDLGDVESISESYADELFGVLAAKYGLPSFSATVTIVGASSQVLYSVARAIKERLSSGNQSELRGDLQLLVAAKYAQERSACSCG